MNRKTPPHPSTPHRSRRIAGAGLLALDVIVSAPDRPEALTFAGGTCGNVLSILSFLRWDATPIGYLGDDPAGHRVLADLAAQGIQAQHLVQRAEWNTPVFIQRLTKNEDGRPTHSFANATHCPHCGHPLADKITRGKVGATPIQRFAHKDPIDVFFMDRLSEDILSLAASARDRGALVFYEPSAKTDARYWQDAFELVDIVKYSADRFDADELGPFMRRPGRDLWEIQTHGAKGLHYRRLGPHPLKGARWTASAAIPTTRIVDTCGAGDWCSAGLIHGLSTFATTRDAVSFAKAIRFGQLLAAWACAFVGARGAMYCNDRQATWSAIQSVVESRRMELSRMPFAAQNTPSESSKLSACMVNTVY
jgi:sugar/nucleoside kinase (ribokinase family)